MLHMPRKNVKTITETSQVPILHVLYVVNSGLLLQLLMLLKFFWGFKPLKNICLQNYFYLHTVRNTLINQYKLVVKELNISVNK